MRHGLMVVPLLALLASALWFAYRTWTYLGVPELPAYAYLAMAGGVLFSLLVGVGLMALMFYSSRHGYDNLHRGDKSSGRE